MSCTLTNFNHCMRRFVACWAALWPSHTCLQGRILPSWVNVRAREMLLLFSPACIAPRCLSWGCSQSFDIQYVAPRSLHALHQRSRCANRGPSHAQREASLATAATHFQLSFGLHLCSARIEFPNNLSPVAVCRVPGAKFGFSTLTCTFSFAGSLFPKEGVLLCSACLAFPVAVIPIVIRCVLCAGLTLSAFVCFGYE